MTDRWVLRTMTGYWAVAWPSMLLQRWVPFTPCLILALLHGGYWGVGRDWIRDWRQARYDRRQSRLTGDVQGPYRR